MSTATANAVAAVPIVNLGALYINNLQVTRTSNTVLAIAAGQCRDSTNVFDIVSSTALALNSANTGANGIDTGTFAASKMYAVYMIMDPTNTNAVASVLSLSIAGPTVMPSGYSAYRLIGYWGTNGSTQFYIGEYVGNGNVRTFYLDAILATPITAGASATFAAVVLTNLVPPQANLEVDFYMDFTANAAADTAAFRPTGSSSTNGEYIMIAPVAGATAHTERKVRLAARTAAGVPGIDYKASAGTIAVSVVAFVVQL